MARYSKTLTPEAQAAFLAALAGGALVAAAAEAAGVALSTLYWRRGRDPDFAAEWEDAVTLSCAPLWDGPPPEGPFRLGGGRRMRFGGLRRWIFLAALERDCDTTAAARQARIHKSTVYRHLARDPDFARDNRATLERGYSRLGRELEQERLARAERLRDWEIEPIGRPTRDFDEQMRLLARWQRRDGSLGPRQVRHGRMKRWTFERAIAELDRRLRGIGVRPRTSAAKREAEGRPGGAREAPDAA